MRFSYPSQERTGIGTGNKQLKYIIAKSLGVKAEGFTIWLRILHGLAFHNSLNWLCEGGSLCKSELLYVVYTDLGILPQIKRLASAGCSGQVLFITLVLAQSRPAPPHADAR